MVVLCIAIALAAFQMLPDINIKAQTQPFFTFTAQGMLIFCAILGVGWKAISMLRRFDRNASIWLWEHEVMWQHFKIQNPQEIPQYPTLIIERRRVPRTPSMTEQANKRQKEDGENNL